jgi:regulator of protease activity HflC (stomatin/prohibitin superfamily)
MVRLTKIVLAAVAIALGHVVAGVRTARPIRRGLIERFGEYGASRSWISLGQ